VVLEVDDILVYIYMDIYTYIHIYVHIHICRYRDTHKQIDKETDM